MKKNMGGLDRTVRIIVAILAVIAFYMEIISGTMGVIVLIVAGVFVLTSIISFCPLYTVLGMNTCPKKE